MLEGCSQQQQAPLETIVIYAPGFEPRVTVCEILSMNTKRRHQVLSIRYGDGGASPSFVPMPMWNEQEREPRERCGLTKALGWINEGLLLGNRPIRPSDTSV